jgi:RNA-directed DNA polymerase
VSVAARCAELLTPDWTSWFARPPLLPTSDERAPLHSGKFIADSLARAFVAGAIEPQGMSDRGAELFGRRRRWLPSLARRVAEQFAIGVRPRLREVTTFLLADQGFRRATASALLRLPGLANLRSVMAPAAPAARWSVPAITTAGQLAEWLGVGVRQLDWFADVMSRERITPAHALRHYHYRWIPKRDGFPRLVEMPKTRLKAIQRRVLHEILDHIPPHEAAHGFRTRRSIRSFAQPHTGQRIVLRMDLQDFFPTMTRTRVISLFMFAGYPESVATLLAGLCTNSVPNVVFDELCAVEPSRRWHLRQLLGRPHLPQGAPTSPAIANLCTFRLDCRLDGLARATGAVYTRYADDLAFSGDERFARSAGRFHIHAAAIALEEGFQVNFRKTRIMRSSVRQRLAGVVVNEQPNVARADFDRLKATLHNSIRLGPASQNLAGHADFRAHLTGRVAFVEMLNPRRGRKLRTLLERIAW